VFGIAVLASVFNRPGVYTSPESFVSGFRSALWVAVAFSAVGIPLAALLRRRPARDEESSVEGVAAVENAA
jgi:hypothetical protein